jgi:hypothetical protein
MNAVSENVRTDVTTDIMSVAKATPVQPEFLRLPPPRQHDPLFGLTRSYLNTLILPCAANGYRPEVKSVVLRRRGSRYGVRLVSVASLRAFILAHEAEGAGRAENKVGRI